MAQEDGGNNRTLTYLIEHEVFESFEERLGQDVRAAKEVAQEPRSAYQEAEEG